jgi:hypothetical protein
MVIVMENIMNATLEITPGMTIGFLMTAFLIKTTKGTRLLMSHKVVSCQVISSILVLEDQKSLNAK